MQPIKTKVLGDYKSESLSESERFEKAVKPLMEFLLENHHPHVSVIVTSTTAELVEGLMTYTEILKA